MPGTATASAVRVRLPALLDAVLVTAGLVLLLRTPRFVGTDGTARLEAVRELAEARIPELTFSLVMPLAALPLHQLSSDEAVLYAFNGLVLAALIGCLWALLRATPAAVSAALVRRLALLLVFASMFPAHVSSFYGETLTAACVAVGLVAVALGRSATLRAVGWALVVVGVVNTPAALPALALVALVHVVWTRRPWALVALAAAAGLIALDLWLRTGGFSSSYLGSRGVTTVLPYSGRPGFSYPMWFGVLGILLSFGKGLVFFAPGLFLPVSRRLRAAAPRLVPAYVLGCVLVVGLVLVYSRWWAWYGGYFWGPRFFLLASVVAALVLAVRLSTPEPGLGAAVATLLALTLSSWVAVSAVLGNAQQEICQAEGYAREHLCWFVPEFSVLWQPLVTWPPTSPAQKAFIALCALTWLRLAGPLLVDVARRLRDEAPEWFAARELPS